MNIGVLGSGIVGRTLGTGLIGLGHKVMIGSRDTSKPALADWEASSGGSGALGTFDEAASFGEMVFLCTSWEGTESALQLAGPENMAGKIVVDVTNPLDTSSHPPKLAVGHTTSGGEIIQNLLSESHVVKAFNIVTARFMVDGEFAEGRADMFIAGNDQSAKEAVAEIVEAFRWNCHDMGDIEAARILEYYAMLWIAFGFRTGTWNHAFRMVRK